MRELERLPQPSSAPPPATPERVAIVGDGRLGNALAGALRAAGVAVDGPLRRDATPGQVDAVLLCVPDGQIRVAADAVASGLAVGHCSGATGLDVFAGSGRDVFSLHP
ncbi:MAG: DUF2520 domain-containing protein, partial [Solirubrobacteraceae bacterium]